MCLRRFLTHGLGILAFVLLLAPFAAAQQYAIVHALYGVPGRNVDVTGRLRELARRDVSFKVENATFGIDPAPGQVKILRIFARGADGRERTFDYRPGNIVDGARFSGWGEGHWGDERWEGDWNGRRR